MKHDPLWMADQVTYQIFPERFAIGKPYTSETKLKLLEYGDRGYSLRRWDEMPENPSRGKDFFGGDLQGIIDHLDYIQDLGVTALYLTPIFVAPSNHKYDTTDFFTIDPQFGGEKALKALVRELKRRKMRLILDAVFNHVSDSHPWFLAAKRGEKPYKNFFTFESDGNYECWRDHRHMPELNLTKDELQKILFRSKDSVLQRYLDMGVDGWRFDVAVDVGLDVVRAMRAAVRRSFPDAVLLGEVMCYAGDWCNNDKVFHGVMNYYFRDAVLGWLRGEVSARQVNDAADEYFRGYGHAGAVRSWNMLSSHDTPRLRWMIHDAMHRRLAAIAQFTLPGVPFIYYGEEIGMDGGNDPDCRRPMIWDDKHWDKGTLAFYKRIVEIRQSYPALRRGQLSVLGHKLDANALVFLRHTDQINEIALVAINNSTEPLREIIFTPHSHLYHALPMKNLLDPSQVVHMEAGNVRLEVPARTAAIFVPDDTRMRHYKFFKPRNLLARA
ncbi:MAG TPA: glycoside hydrolase family 13 protein [Verrucomicrobiae bacterium]|nr:glycoside hydrolase family 13 protein [Verrucomicrobiae bacterium]